MSEPLPELSALNPYSGLSVDLSSLQESAAEIPDQWEAGQSILGLYLVEGSLGQGGFGQVYKVLHTGWNISLAVKTPQAEQLAKVGGVENFIREAETWVKLGLHPHIVTCFYVRKLGKSPRVFAEYVGGGSLSDWIYSQNGEVPRLYQGGQVEVFRRIVDVAIQFAWGLHYAHEQGLIHQDVKPSNTMVTVEGTVKVTDFGLARSRPLRGSATTGSPDQTLQVEGSGSTPAYCSPEQYQGHILTRRTDLYSWALSVLEMFKGGRRWDVGVKVAHARQFYLLESEPFHEYTLPLPRSIADLLWVCLREDPERRPRTMLEVAGALRVIYEQEMGEVYPRPEPEVGKDIADSLNNRAVSLLDLDRLEEAMQLWDQALAVNPLHPESTYNRGLILWRACRITDDVLVKDLEKVRDANLGNWNAHYLLALVHLERNNCEAAIDSLNRIPVEQAQQKEVQEALRLAQEGLPNSNRFVKELIEWGLDAAVMSLCITSDGKYGLSTFYEPLKGDMPFEIHREYEESRRFYLWNLETGRVSKSFKLLGRYQSPLGSSFSTFRTLSLSKDSHYILVTGYPADSNSSCHELWNISQGKFIKYFKELHENSSNLGHLSADGKFVISGTYKGTLELWNIETGKLQAIFTGHENLVNSIASTVQGEFILSGSDDNTIKLWKVANGDCLNTFVGHTKRVTSVYLSTNGIYALSGSDDYTLKVWETSTGNCLRTFIGHTNVVKSVCISPDDKFALSSSLDATLRLWNVATGRCLHTFIGHENPVFSSCLSSDGRIALSGSAGVIRMWSVGYPSSPYFAPIRLSQVIETEKLITIDRVYQQELMAAKAALAREDMETYAQHIANARTIPGYEKNEELFKAWTDLYRYFPKSSLRNSWEGKSFLNHDSISKITSINFSFDGKLVLSASADGKILLWDIESRQIIREFEGHEEGNIQAYLSRDTRYVLSGSFDKTLRLWDVETGSCIRIFEGHTEEITAICWTSDTRFALSGSFDGTVRLWDVQTGRCLRVKKREYYATIDSLCLSPDEQYYLSANHQVKVWNLSTGEYIINYSDNNIYSVSSMCLSQNMKYLALAKKKGILNLLNVENGAIEVQFKGHKETVTSVCFSSDSKYILSGSIDSTVRLWSIETGECLRVFEGSVDSIRSVSLSPDMKYIVSGSFNGEIKIWFLDWELRKHATEYPHEEIYNLLTNFLTLNTPYTAELPTARELTDQEVTQALTRKPKERSEKDFEDGTSILGSILTGSRNIITNQEAFSRLNAEKFWNELEFQNLLTTLSLAGYGLLKPEIIHSDLLAKLGMFYRSLFYSSIFLRYKNIREIVDRWITRVVVFIVNSFLLVSFIPLEWFPPLKWLILVTISAIISFKFPILSAPVSIFVSLVFLLSTYITPRFVYWLLKTVETVFNVYRFLASDKFTGFPLTGIFSYFLCFYTFYCWDFALWRCFFLSMIPSPLLFSSIRRLLHDNSALPEKKEPLLILFWSSYLLILYLLRSTLSLDWIVCYWAAIIPSIIASRLLYFFRKIFYKIFYKLMKPTRRR